MLKLIDNNTVIKVKNQTEWELVRSDEKRIYSGIDYGFPEKIPYSPVYISLITLVSSTDIFPHFSYKPSTIAMHLGWEIEPNIMTVLDLLENQHIGIFTTKKLK